jgi:predicted ATP-dependent serine protease
MQHFYINYVLIIRAKTNVMETVIKSLTFNQIKVSNIPTLKTGNSKFDEWFSKKGGMVLRSAVYVSGTSGAGKTTLMVNMMNWLKDVTTCMYEREVEAQDVKEQTSNIVFEHNNAHVCDIKTHPHFNDFIKELEILKPKVVIVDSIQAIAMEDFKDMTEENACNHISQTLRQWTRDNEAVLFVIGHNTKEGEFAGRNTIMQFMDAHIDMVFDKKANTRTMSWGKKNRKGPMGTLYYTFEEAGIELYTIEEWEARTQERNFRESFIKFVTNYVSSANVNTESGEKLVNEYNKALKQINKSNDGDKICSDLLNVMMSLSDKHE